MFKIISVVAVSFLIVGCASKQVDTGPKYNIEIIKKK